MLLRAVGNDWISRLGLAESTDGVHFALQSSPAMSPEKDWEVKGCEDPRMVRIDGTYYVGYTAFDGTLAQSAMVTSTDLKQWGERRLLFPNLSRVQRENLPGLWSKAAAVFPEKIGDSYYLFFGDNHIFPAKSQDLEKWVYIDQPVLGARADHFDSAYVEMGPPPIRTDRGWLVLYHGIDRFDNQRTYSLGAALFAIDNPREIIWRCETPILTPTESYETIGMIDIIDGGYETLKSIRLEDIHQMAAEDRLPKAIFCCGAVLEGDEVRLYYSGGDTVICTATVDLQTIFSS
jgi:predicted GH43/DUF377 family glycosyl hydrolase